MSAEEREQFEALRGDFKALKRWYLPATVLLGIIWAVMVGTHYFDNNIATKSDIRTLSTKIDTLRTQQITLGAQFTGHKEVERVEAARIKGSVDSIGSIVKIIQGKVYGKTAFMIQHKDCPKCEPRFVRDN